MKLLILCIVVVVVATLASAVPIDPKRVLVNRPKVLLRRSPQHGDIYVKGQKTVGKVYNPTPLPHLRKGQYMCGSQICRLQPGEVPKGCNGMCQYAVS